MNNNPAISIIIPAHNYAPFLPESIGSVMEQTFPDWECIVVDDGSTDNTKLVMDEWMKKDSRISYYFQKQSGPTIARNYGVEMAKGEFIQFLDADDLIEINKLEKQYKIFQENNECDIVYGGVKYFETGKRTELYNSMDFSHSKTWMPGVSGKGAEVIKALLKENIMVISSPLTRKSLFDKCGCMDESLYYNEDWELWLRFAMNNACFSFNELSQTNALIRVHPSYSKDNLKMFVYGLKVCLSVKDKLKEYHFRKILIPKINYHRKVISYKLLELLKIDKNNAIDTCDFTFSVTGIEKFKVYGKRFQNYPVWVNQFLLKGEAVFNKIKSLIIYGA